MHILLKKANIFQALKLTSIFIFNSIPTFGMGSDGFGGELRLRSATRERKVEGNYTCYVENQAGSDSATFQVYVQGEVLLLNLAYFY